MPHRKDPLSFFIALFIGFIDYLGMGLVFPIFATLLFQNDQAFVSPELSNGAKGMLFAALVGLMPISQFFSAPILGIFSDQKGRKGILAFSLSVGIVAYLIAVMGIVWKSILCLFLYRILFGIATGSISVVQAAVADRSTQENKTKNFALFGLSLGLGFSLGPVLGGVLSDKEIVPWFDWSTPFLFAALLSAINLLLVFFFYRDVQTLTRKKKVNFASAVIRLKEALKIKEIRRLLLVMFVFFSGWNFFMEFISIYLIRRFDFSSLEIGHFFTFCGVVYALSSGILIQALAKRVKPLCLLLPALLLAGIYLFLMPLVSKGGYLYAYMPILIFLISMIYPAATAELSNRIDQESQGEILGVYSSMQSVALTISPLMLGFVVGIYPYMAMVIAATLICAAFVILCLRFPWDLWKDSF